MSIDSQDRSPWLLPLHLSGLDDGELGSARLRFWGGLGLLLVYLGVLLVTDLPLQKALQGLLVFTLFGYLSGVVVAADLSTPFVRKVVCIGLDSLIFSWGFARSDGMLAPIFWMPIFMATGIGMRYGARWATYSACLGGFCATLAMWSSQFWQMIPAVAIGVALGMTVLPIYAVSLSNRIHRQRREAEDRAVALEAASRVDALTGLANRLGYTKALRELLEDAREGRAGAAVFYVDLDGFKAVNDTAGHDIGDVILRQAGMCMQAVLRSSDIAARLGGDEFVLVARGVERADDARQIGAKVLSALSALSVPGHQNLRIGASIGICLVPRYSLVGADRVLRTADLLMLRIKQEGKGACEVTQVASEEEQRLAA